ncbi:glycine--tRNA ligase subunit beta [Miltoncostaea marina]|uniref:glycine--tRNA ligase subunit beta n=1 Tax=Miltoncostaea marina TaxID=2843215 RepID=UPI001C3DCEB7|nr:glycine--tRNA ligase subunit beta [Miltoncostaea marina]
MPDLLLEVGCEELPSSACREIAEQAPGLTAAALAALGLGEAAVEVHVAPRRFAVIAAGLPAEQPASSRTVRGPAASAAFGPDGAPTKAAEGFARGQGVAVSDLVVREDGGREFVVAEIAEPARPLADLVPGIAARLVDGLRFSKTMRWGAGTGLRFSRPVRWIVAKVDERTVPFELHGLTAGEVSMGHRFLGGPVTIGAAGDYAAALREAAVIPGHAARREAIVEGLDAAAAAVGGSWSDPGGKLDEVVFLVEWPSVVTGAFDERHLRLPARVLVTAMQSHQRYFPLEDGGGALLPAFLAVSNGDPRHAETITRGNEGVLDARLQDAEFSFDKDLEAGLEALDARLDAIVFHTRLGSMADKRDRLVAGAGRLADLLGADAATRGHAVEAARLAKADQGAVLVAEFSELEGYVAAEYARRAGVAGEVATAVEEQYLPEGADSPLPSTPAAAIVAAAEKIDNLVGAFAADEAPTGSKDPYGLRRAALGLVRIALDRGWDAPLRELVEGAYDAFAGQGADLVLSREATADAVDAFLADRVVYVLGLEGVGPEAATAALGAGLGGLTATAAWARAIQAARHEADFQAVWTASTRLARLARKGPPEDAPVADGDDPGEAALREVADAALPRIEAAREARDFAGALAPAVGLAEAVDRFFTDVLVNADDPGVRARRYGLVRGAAGVLARIADFERITEGGAR